MKNTTVSQLKEMLGFLGLSRGDSVLVFSNVMSLGKMESELDGVMTALQQTVGDSGTVIFPTFSFSFCEGQVFNRQETPSKCGVLTEYARRLPETFRSVQPIHSFAAVGARAKEALHMTDKTSFGSGSALASMLEMGTRVLLLGTVHNTYIHFVEEKCQVEYRFDKEFSGEIIDGDKRYTDTFVSFVRHLDRQGLMTEDRHPQRQIFFGSKHCREANLGYGTHRLFRAQDFCDFFEPRLKEDPLFFVDREKYFASMKPEAMHG